MTSLAKSLTARICERIIATAQAPIDAAVMPHARRLFLDGIAVAVAGSQHETAPGILAGYFAEQGGKGQASLIGLHARLPVVPAALVNGASMHVLDYEPMWLPSTHAVSPALAAALSLGEMLGSTGEQILKAMVMGIEIQGWLRAAAGNLSSHEYNFHPPGFVGPIGSAVASAVLLGFDATQLANAIGISSSRCGGLFANLGTMTKSSHCAYAAAQGLEAALLTQRGFTGSTTAFDEGPQSYGHAFYPKGFDAEMLLNFGATYRIVDPSYAIKIFPAKFTTHYAITAGLIARPQVPSPDLIKEVRMIAADVPSSNRPVLRSGLDGKFSLQYTAAAALLDGQVGIASFTDERLARADMQALLPKMRVTLTREISSKYTEGRYLDMDVELTDGRVIHARSDRPKGSWGAEPVTEAELLTKVQDCLATFLAPADVDACVTLGQTVDTLDGAGIAGLMRLTSGLSAAAVAA
jgi:2-methylcitrate dehydratase PrpD